jgi:hypothetical protein
LSPWKPARRDLSCDKAELQPGKKRPIAESGKQLVLTGSFYNFYWLAKNIQAAGTDLPDPTPLATFFINNTAAIAGASFSAYGYRTAHSVFTSFFLTIKSSIMRMSISVLTKQSIASDGE